MGRAPALPPGWRTTILSRWYDPTHGMGGGDYLYSLVLSRWTPPTHTRFLKRPVRGHWAEVDRIEYGRREVSVAEHLLQRRIWRQLIALIVEDERAL